MLGQWKILDHREKMTEILMTVRYTDMVRNKKERLACTEN